MQCPNCKNMIPNTANVCGYCGSRLREPMPVATAYILPVPPAPVSRKRSIPVWAWIVGIFLWLGMILVLVWAVFFSNININLGSSNQPKLTGIASQPPQQTPEQKEAIQVTVEAVKNSGGTIPTLRILSDKQGTADSVRFAKDQEIFVTWGWCATTRELLLQNMDHVTISFIFDGRTLPLDDFFKSETVQDDSKNCRVYSGVIHSWPVGQHTFEYLFEYLMETDALINDGYSDIPKGKVSHKTYHITVTP
jgi:hypothetical protein